MKNFDGYLKQKLGNDYVLLAGGGQKSLEQIICDSTVKNTTVVIGGTNLFSNSETSGMTARDYTINGYSIRSGSSSLHRISYMNFNGYNGPIAVSFDIKASENCTVHVNLCDINADTNFGESSSTNVTTEYTHHKYVFQGIYQHNSASDYNGFLDMECNGNITLYVKNIKVEKGLVPTDWSLSPWDVANGIGPGGIPTKVDQWKTARTLTIGNTGKSVDGSANVSWSLAEIGAQPAGSYQPAGDYYWSTVKVKTTSDDTTTPIFGQNITIRTKSHAAGPVINFDDYYNGNGNWVAKVGVDYYGGKYCSTTGWTHGMYFITGRSGGYDHFYFLKSDSTPLVKLSSDGNIFKTKITSDSTITGTSIINSTYNSSNKILMSDGSVLDKSTFSLSGHDHDDRYYRTISHSAEWSTPNNMPIDLALGHHSVHVSGYEYSSVLTGKDYHGSYWQLWFHPTSGYTENIQYRATNCTNWKTIADSNNSSVSLSGQTLTVKICGTSQSLTNTWRGIQNNLTSDSTSDSLSAAQGKALNTRLSTVEGDYLTRTTAQTVSGVKTFNNGCWSIAASEANEITTEHFGNGKYYNNANTAVVNGEWSITNALRFRWYSDYWLIGNIRSGGSPTAGFGIAFRDNTNVRQIDCFRVDTGGAYIKGYTALHTGNSSVSKSGETLTVNIGGTSYSLTNTNTWRGIQDNLSSTSTSDSLSANQGRILNNKFGDYVTLATAQTISGAKTFTNTISYSNDGTFKIYGVQTCCGPENIAFQTAFDGQDPLTSTYPTSYPDRAALLLQPRGGRVGINVASNPSYPLHVNGNVGATNYYTTSDARKKQNIHKISDNIKQFEWKETGETSYGFIAQDLEVKHPELVNDDGNMKTVNYNAALSLVVAKLENRVKELEAKLGLETPPPVFNQG